MDQSLAVTALAALAHEGRLAIFRMLVQVGEPGLPAGEIARRVGAPANTLSANLKVLVQATLIRGRREGRSIIYTADYGRMSALLGFLVQDCCDGAPQICAPVVLVAARCCTPRAPAA